ncbi:penicillin-binding protein activator [Novosphingobium sp.]|uniref:penicillin-binding protein activator n=1 Tax=Novosphingobium sp. TaxID=1874826 RepID=UPI001EC50BBE|nr:penicillin-binding protein activator [Novosphingobium sp.]MBK9011768.1 penicillin-binding protein activator [Novosphingobium sp.]
MIVKGLSRRVLVAVSLVALAGCQVVPKGPKGPPPAPEPTDSLPADKQRHRIALLLPLSGQNAALGQSLANATTMALLDTNAQSVRITSYDTAAGPAAAAAQAMKDGNRLVLGPIAAAEVAPVAAAVRARGVPLITYSNEASVAARDVFVMGNLPENSVARTVGYAASRGVRRYALLAPNGDYGTRLRGAYAAAITAAGGTFVTSEGYDRANTSVVSAARRLKVRGGFDAVLIADGPRFAALAAPQLKAPGVRILGTELWSGEASISATPALRGAWYSAVSDARFRQFADSYKARFGAAPWRTATQGYDSVLLTVRIAREWKVGTPFPTARLADSGGFLGLDGPFRFGANGIGERALEVREVRAGGVTVLSPAPEKFAD